MSHSLQKLVLSRIFAFLQLARRIGFKTGRSCWAWLITLLQAIIGHTNSRKLKALRFCFLRTNELFASPMGFCRKQWICSVDILGLNVCHYLLWWFNSGHWKSCERSRYVFTCFYVDSTSEKFHYVIISNVKACSSTDSWRSLSSPRRTIYFLKLNGLSNIL